MDPEGVCATFTVAWTTPQCPTSRCMVGLNLICNRQMAPPSVH